jgi:acetate kinase
LDRILTYIGSYFVKLSGSLGGPKLDGIVFSGGIGEKSVDLRQDVGSYFKWLGCEVVPSINEGVNDEQAVTEITTKESKVKLFVCLTVSRVSFLQLL